jgi:hypothetical protein
MSNTLSVFLRSGKVDTQVGTLIRERSGLMRFIVEGAYIALGENRPNRDRVCDYEGRCS